MYNDLLKIGPLTVHGYGLMIAIGVFVALSIAEHRAPKNNLDKEQIFPLTIFCVVTGIFGAKLLFIIQGWEQFLKDPLSMLGSSGLVVYGGIIVGTVCASLYCKIRKLYFWDYFDIVLPSVAVAQAFGRIGCFLAGCCYGQETSAWYGITFTHSHYAPNNVKMIPTQLLSSAGMFLIAGLLFLYARRAKRSGQIGAAYMILYSIGRFIIEFWRGDLERGTIGALSTSQFISLFIVVIGIGLWIWRGKVGTQRPQAEKSKTTIM